MTGAGYDCLAYTIHAHVPGATLEPLAELRRRVEYSSPVGDSLACAIPFRMSFDAHPQTLPFRVAWGAHSFKTK